MIKIEKRIYDNAVKVKPDELIMDVTIQVSFGVSYLENKSGLSDEELGQKISDLAKEERDALVMEAKICAIKLLAGEKIDE